MAWTQAARDAAAMARKMKSTQTLRVINSKSGMHQTVSRSDAAKTLVSLRSALQTGKIGKKKLSPTALKGVKIDIRNIHFASKRSGQAIYGR